jgi:hypothetical protein
MRRPVFAWFGVVGLNCFACRGFFQWWYQLGEPSHCPMCWRQNDSIGTPEAA